MSFYVFETRYKHARTCNTCNKGMSEGYLHEGLGDAYCTASCVFTKVGAIVACGLIDSGLVFWTTWYDEVEVVE